MYPHSKGTGDTPEASSSLPRCHRGAVLDDIVRALSVGRTGARGVVWTVGIVLRGLAVVLEGPAIGRVLVLAVAILGIPLIFRYRYDIRAGSVPAFLGGIPVLVLLLASTLTYALASTEPPTNPLVVLQAARWWYIHGTGGSDPAFQWAIEWARRLATDTPSDVDRFDEFLEYLVTVGLADDTAELR